MLSYLLLCCRLQAENAKLIKRLVELKENEVERMNQINKLHEEAVSEEKTLVCVVQVASMRAVASAACTLCC